MSSRTQQKQRLKRILISSLKNETRQRSALKIYNEYKSRDQNKYYFKYLRNVHGFFRNMHGKTVIGKILDKFALRND